MLGVSNKYISLQKLNNLIPNYCLKNLTQLTGKTNRSVGKQGWTSSWTDPPSPKPPRWVFWLVRPHKVSVTKKLHLPSFVFMFIPIEIQTVISTHSAAAAGPITY